MEVDKIEFVDKWRDDESIDYLNSLSPATKFNPSFYCDDNVQVWAWRELPHLVSFVSVNGQIINLGSKLMDPKVFTSHGEVFVTMHTGYVGGNRIFVQKLWPNVEQEKEVFYAGRNGIHERNWSFFDDYCLYSINPMCILNVERTDKAWFLTEYVRGQDYGLSLGTQMHGGMFIGHLKLPRNGRKLYLGKLMSPRRYGVELLSPWLAHSIDSLQEVHIEHSKNIYSATYFSGLQVYDNYVKVGYGINDSDFGISNIPLTITKEVI